jgi:filamentous hemagglutinin family protein
MFKCRDRQLPAILFILFLLASQKTSAQIVPDNSLGQESSTVISNVEVKDKPADLVSGGAIRENNLFHSFSQFNVSEGGRVYFANPQGVQNILTRVTGSNPSEILGTLGVGGTANLFFLNPNGIVFGNNARLEVAGSFLATTADSFVFNNNFAYSASAANVPSLLAINIPIGLQFGAKAESIVNRSRSGLSVLPGQALGLIGGDIFLEGARVNAIDGQIELGSVASQSAIALHPGWMFNYENVEQFQDIGLNQTATVDTSGIGGGKIGLQGRNISLKDGSLISANTVGMGTGGGITVNASKSLELTGANPSIGLTSNLVASVLPGATGIGGNVKIETGRLYLADGARISTGTSGNGNAGDLSVRAIKIEAIGSLLDLESNSGLYTTVLPGATGKGGDLTVDTQQLNLTNGARILAGTFGFGDSGDLFVRAEEIVATGITVSDKFPSGLLTTVLPGGTGKGGNLTVEAQRIYLADGAIFSAGTAGTGDSGDLNVRAKEISATDNVGLEQLPSGLFTTVLPEATGRGGNLTVETDRLFLANGAVIGTGTSGNGDSGDLFVRAKEIEATGNVGLEAFPSGLFTTVNPGAIGRGGNLTVEAQRIYLADGGAIGSGTLFLGVGDAGDLSVRATEIVATGSGAQGLFPSGLYSIVGLEAKGNGGNLQIDTQRLQILNGAAVSTSTFGFGNAGSLRVRAAESVELDRSRLFAGVQSNAIGNGGNISIDTADLSIADGALISSSSDGNGNAGSVAITAQNLSIRDGGEISVSSSSSGDAGNLNVTTDSLRLDNTSSLSAEVGNGDRGNINLSSKNILLRRGSEITTNATGTATGGNISIDTDILVALEESQIVAKAIQGQGGNINITTQGLFLASDSIIDASSKFGVNGTVQINNPEVDPNRGLIELPEETTDPSQQIAIDCNANQENGFTVIGRGGLPEDPTTNLRSNTLWSDLRLYRQKDVKDAETQTFKKASDSLRDSYASRPELITEARGWKLNQNGNVELVSPNPQTTLSLAVPNCLDKTSANENNSPSKSN